MNRAVLCLLLLRVPILSAAQSDARIIKPEIRVGDNSTYRSTNMVAPGTNEHEIRVSFADAKTAQLRQSQETIRPSSMGKSELEARQ